MKKIGIFFLSALILASSNFAMANSEENSTLNSSVSSIKLYSGSNNKIEWSVEGYSKEGFKVVWSKNQGPTYPLRDGDKYHYYANPSFRYDVIDNAFAGEGAYYVRVCEYLDGKCGIYSNEITLNLTKPTEPVKIMPVNTKDSSGNSIENSDSSIKEGDQIPSGYEKIPNLESISLYSNIKKIGDSLYGVKAESQIPTNYQKIPRIEDIKYYKNIKRVGNALYGIKIVDEKKKQLQTKIDNLNSQIKKIQDQINELVIQMSSLN